MAGVILFCTWCLVQVVLGDHGYIYKIHFKEINIKNRVYNYCFDNLIKAKTSKTTNFLIDEKSYKDLIITFAKYDR